MRSFVILAGAALVLGVLGGVASAQPASPAPPAASKGYVEGVVQSAFGNVTSQSFGAEFGYSIMSDLQVFVDAGLVRDAAPSSIGAGAQLIAGYLSQTQSNVTFRGKVPITFGVAGVRYRFKASSKVEPYVLAGGGIAKVKRDVTFTVNGTDVTNSLEQFGIRLGTDLSGSETKPMLSIGVGAVWPAWQKLIVDFQYRYGRVFTDDEGLNVSRAGVGIGVRF